MFIKCYTYIYMGGGYFSIYEVKTKRRRKLDFDNSKIVFVWAIKSKERERDRKKKKTTRPFSIIFSFNSRI